MFKKTKRSFLTHYNFLNKLILEKKQITFTGCILKN